MPETSLPVEHLFTFTGTVGRGTFVAEHSKQRIDPRGPKGR